MCYVRWTVSPEAFSVGGLTVRYYGLFLAVAFLTVAATLCYVLKCENKPLLLVPVILNAVFLSALVGARLGECFFYFPEYYLQNPTEIILPFRDGRYVGIGGLSSHGAALAIVPALILTARRRRQSPMQLIDSVCLSLPPAAFFIRIGNLMNSEIVGTETSAVWGFIFETRNEDFARHPVQIYEALCYLCIFFLLIKLYRTKRDINSGIIFGLFLSLTFFCRFIIEIYKAPLNEFDLHSIYSTSQYLNLFFALAGTVILYCRTVKNNRSEVGV
ncbi:MAG: prolipoprotein diacylglyceryl transferase [Prevotellaceae bacterium]|nr:prolipoprotein diacylglyceryl transferase [Prevotellaceae bacterium]